MSEKVIIYSEPVEYFPKDTREEFFPELNVDSERFNEIARIILGNMLEKTDDENISIGRPDPTREEVIEAAKKGEML